MADGEEIAYGVAKEPYHKSVAVWTVDTYTTMPESIKKKAWMKRVLGGFKIKII